MDPGSPPPAAAAKPASSGQLARVVRRVTVLGIRAGKGAPVPGAENGPFELRKRGLITRLELAGHSVDDLGDIPGVYETRFAHDGGDSVNNLRNVLQVNRHTHACVLGTRRKSPESFLLVIGGDHSLAIGTLAGLSDACQRLGIIWIDAHADFNTPLSSPSGNIHGMSLAVACGYGHLDLRLISDYDPMVEEQDVFLLGPRDIDDGEQRNLDRSEIHMLSTQAWRAAGLAQTVVDAVRELSTRCDHIHLSFDIDVLDAATVMGTGTPVGAGLSRSEAIEALRALAATQKISSAEFVEYNPALDRDGSTGQLTLDLITELLLPARPDLGQPAAVARKRP